MRDTDPNLLLADYAHYSHALTIFLSHQMELMSRDEFSV